MAELQITTRLRIRAGSLEHFKNQARECIRQATSKDVGLLRYDWFISRDGAMCEIREAYSDSEALLLHRANVAEAEDRLFREFADERVATAYGEPSPQQVRLADILGPSVTWYSPLERLRGAYATSSSKSVTKEV